MTDPKLEKALKECQKTLVTSLKALTIQPDNSPSSSSSSSSIPPALGDIVGQLLAQLRQSITALGLAYNPPITIDAAIQQLEKTLEFIGKLISCVLLSVSSPLLHEEWKSGITNITEEVIRHIKVLHENGDYLNSTGLVWRAIDNSLNDLSKDENGALRRKWKAHQGTVKDAWEEFKELLESKNDNKEEEDDQDDEFVDLDLGGEELSEEEKKRAEHAKPLLALHQILHSTIPRFMDQLSETEYRSILQISSEFVDAYDDVVSSMHPEQDESDIEESLLEVEEISRKLAGKIQDKSIDKWTERLEVEKNKWEERRLNLDSLKNTI